MQKISDHREKRPYNFELVRFWIFPWLGCEGTREIDRKWFLNRESGGEQFKQERDETVWAGGAVI